MHGPEGEGSFAHIRDLFLAFLSSYGWILAGVVAVFFLMKPRILSWLYPSSDTTDTAQPAPDVLQKQKDAVNKLQAQFDEAALIYAAKHKEKEAEILRKKIEERLTTTNNSGQRLGSTPSPSKSPSPGTKPKKPTGPRLRNADYNPLTGSSGSEGYRPSGSGRNCGPKGG